MAIHKLGYLFALVVFSFSQAYSCRWDICAPVGVAYKHVIPDSSFTASSQYSSLAAKYARLHGVGAWESSGNSNPDDYLQIDLGKVFAICALATQGVSHDYSWMEWTTEYKILTSIDNKTWTYYPSNTSPKLFPGNSDKHTVVKNVLNIPVQAKLIRFYPTKWNGWKALRVEMYGVEVKGFSCRSLPVGVKNMASSSQYNTSTPASNGRLGYTAGSSWCSAVSDSSPYLRISLGSPYIICGVATQGDHNTDQWVQTYQIHQSTDGFTFTDYKQNNLVKTFRGNFDSNTIVHNTLYEGAIGQSIGIKPKSKHGSTNCMRTELYGVQNTACTKMSIGLSYSLLIPDHRFTANSYYSSSYKPSYARLITSTFAWGAASSTHAGHWLQIDIGSVVYVCAVATQGTGSSLSYDEYTKKYNLRVSLDNNIWEYYQENNMAKIFHGNTDRHSIVTNTLPNPVKAKFLRLYPIEVHSYAAFRVEVYGVPLACTYPIGLEVNGIIKDHRITSSSDLNSSYNASHGRLYGDRSWCSMTSSNTEYLQINLGKVVTVTGIATQGDHTMDRWVKSYTIRHSIDGNLWTTYNSNKVISGNIDREAIVVHGLSPRITARYVKIQPQTWNAAICMRIELYGCTCSIIPEELSNQNLSASINSQVDLVCKVQDVSIQYIEWYSDGKDITSLSSGITRGADFVKSVLQVNYTNAYDIIHNFHCWRTSASMALCRKKFVCRVKYNKLNTPNDGIKGAGVKVMLEYPSTPSMFLVGKSVNSVTLKLTQPALKPSQLRIQSCDLELYNFFCGTKKTFRKSTSSGNVTYTINGLTTCKRYGIKVRAFSSLGYGPWGDNETFETLSESPEVPPGNVQAKAETSTGIRVTWQVPSGLKCPALLSYKVVYSLTSLNASKEVSVGHITSYKITNLNKNTDYSISVKAYNKQGDGPISVAVVERTLQDAPSVSPGNFQGTPLNSASARLSWSLPPTDQQNGIIRGFRVWYKKASENCFFPEIQINGNSSLHYVVGSLDVYTEYSFKVLAYTNQDGPYSDVIQITTHEGRKTEGQSQECACTNQECFLGIAGYVICAVVIILIVLVIILVIHNQRLRKKLYDESSKNQRRTPHIHLDNETIFENTDVTRSCGDINMTDINPVYEHVAEIQNPPQTGSSQQLAVVDPSNENIYQELQPQTRTTNQCKAAPDLDTIYEGLTKATVEEPIYENVCSSKTKTLKPASEA